MRNTMKQKMFNPVKPLHYWLLIAMISSLLVVSRVALSFIPNFKPLTATFLIVAVCFELYSGILLMTVTLVASNLFFGMGPWFFQQWFGFLGAIIFGIYFIKIPLRSIMRNLYNSLILAISGFIFGAITSIWYGIIYQMSFQAIIAYWLRGLPFDLSHAIGNAIFWYLLSPTLIKLLENYKFKFLPYLSEQPFSNE